jgi:acyl-CoA reductase-like NAD-dependent aldehyde dehydrogenase
MSTANSDQAISGLGRDPRFQEANLERGFYNIIDGQKVSSAKTLTVINPSNGKPLAAVPDIDRSGLDRAVAAARKALGTWSATPFAERRRMLTMVLSEIAKHTEELSVLLTAEQGQPLAGARIGFERFSKEFGSAILQSELREEEKQTESMGRVVIRYVPLGVVCAISPWNVPFLLSFCKVLPALLAGNTVVLKPSPFTPLTVLRTADYIHRLLPPGVFNAISGGDDLGPWMTAHPGFDKIDFTGSTQTGKRVLQSAAAGVKRVTLELGGNDPGIVLPDAHPEKIAEPLFQSMFRHNGQACMALKRLYVHDAVYAKLTKALTACAAKLKTADGFDPDSSFGPVQNRPQYERLLATWKQIEESGSAILFQGKVPPGSEGFYFPITMIDNPPDNAPFVSEEVFGPIRSILRYTDVEDAIRRANNTPYGLGASVWGEDSVMLQHVAQQLNAGTVWINQHSALRGDIPFGGHKSSGLGVQFGNQGLASYCDIQVVATKG